MKTHSDVHATRILRRLLMPAVLAGLAGLLLAPLPDAHAGGRRGQRARGAEARRGQPEVRDHRAGRNGQRAGRAGERAGRAGERAGRAGQRDGQPSQRGNARGGRRAQPLRASLARTHILLKIARASIKKSGSGKDRFKAAALQQRAAGIALRQKAPAAALYLTREARETAREIIRQNGASEPTQAADRPGEFKRADGAGADSFIERARKQKRNPKMGRSLGKSGRLLLLAVRAGKKGGKGGAAVRRAAVLQRAARAARLRGQWKVSLHLTGQSRKSAREALAANGVAEPATTADEAGEFTEATPEEASTYVEEAEAAVPTEIDETAVESAESSEEPAAEATPDVDETAAEVDFEGYEYEEEEAATTPSSTQEPGAAETAQPEATSSEAAAE
jgi:hypothetical protein